MIENKNYKSELKQFLKENLDAKKYEIFEVRPGFLIRYDKKDPICFKFSEVGIVKMLKEDVTLTQEDVFKKMLSLIKKELKKHVREIKNKK